MKINGIEVFAADMDALWAGICPACGATLPATKDRVAALSTSDRHVFTCDAVCHRVWIERLIVRIGDTTRITHIGTGKTHLVPTRVILEQGIRGADLSRYPEAPQ